MGKRRGRGDCLHGCSYVGKGLTEREYLWTLWFLYHSQVERDLSWEMGFSTGVLQIYAH